MPESFRVLGQERCNAASEGQKWTGTESEPNHNQILSLGTFSEKRKLHYFQVIIKMSHQISHGGLVNEFFGLGVIFWLYLVVKLHLY